MNEEINNIWLNNIKEKLDEKQGTNEEIKKYEEIAKQMNYGDYAPKNLDEEITTKTALNRLMECNHVYEVIPKFQREVCTNGNKWIDLIQSYLCLAIFVYLISLSMQRFAHYTQKKIDEKKVKYL